MDGKIENAIFKFIDTPGESRHDTKRKDAILKTYGHLSIGVINVVSYGYHEGTVPRGKALDGNNASEGYLTASRATEIHYLAEWTSLLAGRNGPAKWLITVATKADLWWGAGQEDAVFNHYRSGPYFMALGEAKEITHSVRSYSSLNQLFYKTAPMSGFYSDDQRVKDRDSLVALILEYCSERTGV